MDSREELMRNMRKTNVNVSGETLERVQQAMKVQASKKMIQGRIDAGGADRDLLVGAIRRMMEN